VLQVRTVKMVPQSIAYSKNLQQKNNEREF
jgi:hypothetical protein